MRHNERIELIRDSIAKMGTGLLQVADIAQYDQHYAGTLLRRIICNLELRLIDLDHAVVWKGEEE